MNKEQLQYPAFDQKTGRVTCQICGESFQVISPTHLKKHNLSYADYIKRYPTAPLSSKEFNVKTKYGKVKELFAPKEKEVLEEVIVNETPTIENEIDVEKILKENSFKDPIKQVKSQILDDLKSFFTNIRQDYLIEEYGKVSGRLKYQFITDFTDPILKVIVQFPNTFWHNRESNTDPLKNEKLEADGWKVLTVKGRAPSRRDIQKVVDSM